MIVTATATIAIPAVQVVVIRLGSVRRMRRILADMEVAYVERYRIVGSVFHITDTRDMTPLGYLLNGPWR